MIRRWFPRAMANYSKGPQHSHSPDWVNEIERSRQKPRVGGITMEPGQTPAAIPTWSFRMATASSSSHLCSSSGCDIVHLRRVDFGICTSVLVQPFDSGELEFSQRDIRNSPTETSATPFPRRAAWDGLDEQSAKPCPSPEDGPATGFISPAPVGVQLRTIAKP